MTMINWDDEDKDSMPPPLMAKQTYINDEGDESSLESDENSVLDSTVEDTTTSLTSTTTMNTTMIMDQHH